MNVNVDHTLCPPCLKGLPTVAELRERTATAVQRRKLQIESTVCK
jgi:hypothetical protein